MGASFKIRLATEADLPEMVAIYNSSIPGRMATADIEPVNVESRMTWFDDHAKNNRPLWVAVNGNEVVGYLSVRDFYSRTAYKSTVEVGLYVHPNYQKQGLGKQLLNHLEANAKAFDLRILTAYIFAHNAPSLKLFRSFGYEQWAHLPSVAIIDSKMIDLLILGKQLPE